METSRRPGTAFRHRFTLEGERSLVDTLTASLINAKLELVDERRIAHSEVMT
jgi:hypothetical protein